MLCGYLCSCRFILYGYAAANYQVIIYHDRSTRFGFVQFADEALEASRARIFSN